MNFRSKITITSFDRITASALLICCDDSHCSSICLSVCLSQRRRQIEGSGGVQGEFVISSCIAPYPPSTKKILTGFLRFTWTSLGSRGSCTPWLVCLPVYLHCGKIKMAERHCHQFCHHIAATTHKTSMNVLCS